jgi:hypothetical protein
MSALGLLTIIVFKFVRIAGDLYAISVRIQKTNRTVAGNFQCLRAADYWDLSSFKKRIQIIDFLVGADIDAEVVEFRNAVTTDCFRSFGQLHERHVMMLPTIAQEGHFRPSIARRHFEPEHIAVESLRLLQVSNVQDNVTQYSALDRHRIVILSGLKSVKADSAGGEARLIKLVSPGSIRVQGLGDAKRGDLELGVNAVIAQEEEAV